MEERKLKPIYDELERARPKGALSEIEKYKKRYPKQANTPIIGALQCVALQRLGMEDEAYETFLTMVKANRKNGSSEKGLSVEEGKEIPADVVIDESVLHTLGYALRPMRKLSQLMRLYENAWAADPENLELGVQVFQHAVRIHDWRTMQQASQTDTPAKQRTLLLKLAQSLIDRAPSTPYQNEDTLLLYIKILRAMGNEGVITALRILTPDLKQPFQPDDKSPIPLELQKVSHEKQSRKEREAVRKWMTDLRFRWERWEMIEEVAASELRNENNAQGENGQAERWNWEDEFVRCDDLIRGAEDIPETNYKAYLSLVSSLMVLMTKGEGDVHLKTARDTLDGLTLRFGDQERAPLLAHLEINRRLRESQIQVGEQSEAHSDDTLLMAYWAAFGHKGSVLDDLTPYLTPQSDLVDTLTSLADHDSVDYKEYIRQLNAYKLLQMVRPRANNADEQRKIARKQFKLYLHGTRFGQGIPLTDVKPADDFGLLSAQAYIDTWTITDQKDLRAGGDKGRAMISKLLLNSKGIYESTEREISEAMVAAFTSESYSQIPGMLKLSQRFGNSHQRFLGELELVRQSALRDYNELTNEKSVAIENLKRDKGTSSSVEVSLDVYNAHDTLHFWALAYIEDVRDWDLLPDYVGGDGLLTLKQQTSPGGLTDSAWIKIMSNMWLRILDPESVKDEAAVTETSEQTTYCEKQLISFGHQLAGFAQECKSGDAKEAESIKREFAAMVTTATAVHHSLPWKMMHSWSIIIEAYAMLEIALSPYKPLSGKKAKKGQASGVPSQIGEVVKGVFVECKSALKTLASQAASLASEDEPCPSGMLINALKESGFAEQVNQFACFAFDEDGLLIETLFWVGRIILCSTVRD
ncbi:hypothetical protein QFC19_002318 [Naganishia cerealis]|uniref:Uncharacterized protein n=1 Tax=Naganishia cerealis TaxID=610337 RepID=A0ACC2WBZ3_9TREE|nr:hypothetical protein QFC19_002318 [Naganishia cerealis]